MCVGFVVVVVVVSLSVANGKLDPNCKVDHWVISSLSISEKQAKSGVAKAILQCSFL